MVLEIGRAQYSFDWYNGCGATGENAAGGVSMRLVMSSTCCCSACICACISATVFGVGDAGGSPVCVIVGSLLVSPLVGFVVVVGVTKPLAGSATLFVEGVVVEGVGVLSKLIDRLALGCSSVLLLLAMGC